MPPVRKKLGQILLEMGAIDPLQLQSALGQQQQWGRKLGRTLVEARFCSPDDVLRALSLQNGHPVVDLDAYQLDPALAKVLPLKTAERLEVVPLSVKGKRGEELVVAAAAPAGLETVDGVRAASGKARITIHLAWDEAIARAIDRLYRGRNVPPPRPVDSPVRTVSIEGEAMLELEPESGGDARPVLLYGWHEASARALARLLEFGGVASRVVSDDELPGLSSEDVVIAPTLALVAALPPGGRLAAQIIVAGMPDDDSEVDDARKLGARMYLRAPFSSERVCGAVRRCRTR